MKKPRISIDLDGVIRDIYNPLREKVIAAKDLSPRQVPATNSWKYYEIAKSLNQRKKIITEQELRDIWFCRERWNIYYYGAKLYQGIKRDLAGMHSKYSLILNTAQPMSELRVISMQWLFGRTGISYYFDEIHFSQYHTKHMVYADAYVDDSPAVIKALAKHVPPHSRYLMDRPWNQRANNLELWNIDYKRIKFLSEINV